MLACLLGCGYSLHRDAPWGQRHQPKAHSPASTQAGCIPTSFSSKPTPSPGGGHCYRSHCVTRATLAFREVDGRRSGALARVRLRAGAGCHRSLAHLAAAYAYFALTSRRRFFTRHLSLSKKMISPISSLGRISCRERDYGCFIGIYEYTP